MFELAKVSRSEQIDTFRCKVEFDQNHSVYFTDGVFAKSARGRIILVMNGNAYWRILDDIDVTAGQYRRRIDAEKVMEAFNDLPRQVDGPITIPITNEIYAMLGAFPERDETQKNSEILAARTLANKNRDPIPDDVGRHIAAYLVDKGRFKH
jgi:hypothetical protein